MNDKIKCPLCGGEAEFVQGATYLERLEQYFCNDCKKAFIVNYYGKFIRKGVLKDPIY